MNTIGQKITSVEVSEMIGKDHNKLLRDIRNYIIQLGESNLGHTEFFIESTYQTDQNRTMPCYMVSKKGCEFIAHKLTGIKGTQFTAQYIDRFHDMEDAVERGFDLTQLSPELQAIFAHDKKIQAVMDHMQYHDERLDNLEQTMTVDYGQQKVLNDKHHAAGVEVLGGKKSNAYKDDKLKDKVFRGIWNDYKDYFEIASYRDTPAVRYKEAIEYLDNWVPDINLKLEIQKKNREAA